MTDSDPDSTDDETTDGDGTSRRRVLTWTGGTVLAAYGVGHYSGRATAQTTPSGTFPADTDDPLLKIRTDRIEHVPRSSDPSSPDDGTLWYNGSV